MIRKIREEDITNVMTIWVKGNFKAHSFIDKDYWLLNFNRMKDNYLNNNQTYIYVEDEEIKGFVSVNNCNQVEAIFVKDGFKRKGIGRKLLNYCKERYDKLRLNVYEKNVDATLFYVAMGFKNIELQIDKNTGEQEYIMEWINK